MQPLAGVVVAVVVAGVLDGAVGAAGMDKAMVLVELALVAVQLVQRRLQIIVLM